ncbi:DUF155-domain-containing protein, partial [Basidiobolus meristosporus CBS 931.73]
PNRTTKISQKLALFPDEGNDAFVTENFSDEEVYNQISQIPIQSTQQAKKMIQLKRTDLPRVTAYCTANSYRMDMLQKYLQNRRHSIINIAPKRIDEWYVGYQPTSPLTEAKSPSLTPEMDESLKIGELFFFDYGVIVMWGFSELQERELLMEIEAFEQEKLEESGIKVEELNFQYDPSCQPCIYNDIISLKNPRNYMVKLTISHAIAQSVKMTLFEDLVDQTIHDTKHIPQIMAETGKVHLSRNAITSKIGQLFIVRINVNLVSNILDTPEIFWSEPAQQPLYSAIRGYLEISQRAELLNQRVTVINDLLEMLKDHLNSNHGETLEYIVIILI